MKFKIKTVPTEHLARTKDVNKYYKLEKRRNIIKATALLAVLFLIIAGLLLIRILL